MIPLMLASAALGASLALDPQVRVHAGANVIPGPAGVGFTAGFESRLTRIIAIDIAGFASPMPLADDLTGLGAEDFGDYQLLRHSIFAAPGLRIPHAQPKSWAWDFFLRAGGGVIWLADARPGEEAGGSTDYDTLTDIGGFGGADLMVRFGKVGLRASGKAWMYDAVQTAPVNTFFIVRPQFGIEGLVQW